MSFLRLFFPENLNPDDFFLRFVFLFAANLLVRAELSFCPNEKEVVRFQNFSGCRVAGPGHDWKVFLLLKSVLKFGFAARNLSCEEKNRLKKILFSSR